MNWKAWFMLVRPFTLIAPFMAVIFGVLFQLAAYGEIQLFSQNFSMVLLAALAMASAQAVGQIMNQVEDVEIDRANGKDYRPIVSGEISEEKAQAAAMFFAIFSIIMGYAINVVYGSFMVILLMAGVFYNLEPFRLKRRLWLNTGSLAISRGLLPMPAAWSVFGSVGDATPWLLGSVIALWVMGWQNTKDINDIEGDKRYGIITPAVYHGIKTLTRIITAFSLLSFLLLAIYIKMNLIPAHLAALFILLMPTLWMIYKITKGDFSRITLENNELWAAFYLTLAGFYIVSAMIYLIKPYITLFG
ncbi:MAG: UbiA prenyltransferase family protein [Thermoplasmata archaeon]|nr:UbiA prenyltransferase family protein [Thermoplasmata archaeon]